MKYTEEFESAWVIYPKRAGGNSKAAAFRQWQARLKSNHSAAELGNGAMRYHDFCQGTGKIGTEFVMMAATFFGRDEHFLEEWALPDKKINESLADKANRLSIQPRVGESQSSFDKRVQQTRG